VLGSVDSDSFASYGNEGGTDSPADKEMRSCVYVNYEMARRVNIT
jgi:hypothetical protein